MACSSSRSPIHPNQVLNKNHLYCQPRDQAARRRFSVLSSREKRNRQKSKMRMWLSMANYHLVRAY